MRLHGKLLSKLRQVLLRMALTHKDRQVGSEPGEVTVTTERCGPQPAPDMGQHAVHHDFDLGTQASDRKLR
ncbi:hypothetical protein D3C79_1083030 [compost metagenome]